jgi:hypothetical protein
MAMSGLGVVLGAGLIGALVGAPFLTGSWIVIAGTKLGTPLLFDAGVYVAVIGSVMSLVLELVE